AEIGFKRKPVPTEFAACTPAQLAQVDPWANESKANLHWLSRRSGCAEDKCLLALREAGGDLQQALRRLVPSGNWRKFPDWYYSGPYKTVGDPDRDLPVRESNELSQYEIDNETDRKIDGERLIAPFNDANSLSDISGCILSPTGHPIFCDLEMAAWGHIQANMAEAADRIREKLRRSKNKVRNEFFENAVRLIEIAKDMYFDHRYPEGQACLFEAHRLLQEGNKPKRK
ncbi:MAG TPA: hypothetical protein VKE98_24705, partial [Gemmataceae bacterium]|nr:hypothetical protein [Gemmataceae bacterium]